MPRHEQPGLRRITVNLNKRGQHGMDQAMHINGENQTEVVNRALSLYAYISEHLNDGAELHLRTGNGGELRITLI